MNIPDLQYYLSYFIWGFSGSLVMTWFVRLNEKNEPVEEKFRLISFNSVRTVLFLIWTNIVMGLTGGLFAVAINHNVALAIGVGSFSQFILIALVKWLRTRDFNIAIGEVAGILLKRVAISSTESKEAKSEKGSSNE